MYNLKEAFVMPEQVMLRTQQGNMTVIGSCHMAVPQPEEMTSYAIGSCHMAVPQPEKRQCGRLSIHKEVVALG